MGAILRVILTAVLIFYAFSMLIKLIFRWKMKRLQRKMEQYSENKTNTDQVDSKNPHIDPNIGEYTDFEEVE